MVVETDAVEMAAVRLVAVERKAMARVVEGRAEAAAEAEVQEAVAMGAEE